MESNNSEKRKCFRVEIPGATLDFKESSFFGYLRKYRNKSCLLLDFSRGGLRFLDDGKLKINKEICMRISIPNENEFLQMSGQVKWIVSHPNSNSQFQIGVQFYPYGVEKGENNPLNLRKIEEWEKKFSDLENDSG